MRFALLAASLSLSLAMQAAPRAGFADTVDGTRSELLVENAHEVELSVDRGFATLVVRRTVYNGGDRHDQATFHIDLPGGAVATGLRTLGTLGGEPHWWTGELMEAEAAAARYRELTGIGGYYPKDPALLSWRSQSHLALQVFPCPPRELKSIEYTLTMPTVYTDGAYHVTLPALGTDKLLAHVRAQPARAKDTLLVDGVPIPAGTSVELDRARDVDVALVTSGAPRISGALASHEFGPQRHLASLRFDLAPKLGRVPRGAYVVVIIDASRSLEDEDISGSLAAARAYLSHFEDGESKAEVITFARHASTRFGRFLPVSTAAAALETLTLTRENGSNTDEALTLADQRLARAPRGAPKRVVVLTDARTRSSLTPAVLAASFTASRAIAHVGIASNVGAPTLEPDSAHPWAPVIRETGGLVWAATTTDHVDGTNDLKSVYEEWARPKRLFHAALRAKGLDVSSVESEETMHEGASIAHLALSTSRIAEVTLSGELWAKPVEETLTPSAKEAKRWAALVFGSELLHELSEPEMMKLAMHGGAVSPVTSYLAIEPGVRPSTEGLEWMGSGSGFGTGQGFGVGQGRMLSLSVFDHAAHLQQALAPLWATCGGAPGAAELILETTQAEIVDVPAVALDTPDAKLESCIREAAWTLDLPSDFHDDWQSYLVRV